MVDGLTSSKLSQFMNFIEKFDEIRSRTQARSRSLSVASYEKSSKNTEVASTADTDDSRTLSKQWCVSDPDSPSGSYQYMIPSTQSIPSIWEEGFDEFDLISESSNESYYGNIMADDAAYLATPDPLDLMPYSGALPKFSEKDIADHAAAVTRRLEEDMARQNASFRIMMQHAQAMR
jgi:hypothetical protein